MVAKFTRPCGAFADVKELEYISALHQTGKNELRKDGTIQAIDIVHFLMSRYGINVTEEEVRQRILGAFGECSTRGENLTTTTQTSKSQTVIYDDADAENDDANDSITDESISSGKKDYMDLTQVLALLFIPELLKAEQSLVRQKQIDEKQQLSIRPSSSSFNENENETSGDANSTPPSDTSKRWPDSDLMENVLQMMLHDATGDSNPRPLTKELIRQILHFYGEGDIADDDQLLEEMVQAASDSTNDTDNSQDIEGEPILLDHHAFARALTHDVKQYNIDCENRTTTNYFDVFETFYSTKEDEKKRLSTLMMTVHNENRKNEDVQPVQRVYTFPSIDYTADTYRSKGFVILLWVTWILTYFAYLTSNDVLSNVQLNCDDAHFGCVVLQGITNWLTIMAQLSILGTTFIVWASCGNSVYPANPLWVVLGMVATLLFVIVPFFREFDAAHVVSTQKSEDANKQLLYYLSLGSGLLLLSASILNIVQRFHARRSSGKHDNFILIPGIVRLESKNKQATSYKVNQLVRNACDVHKAAEFDGALGSSAGETKYGRAMLAYARTSDETQEFGGFLHIWQKVFNGNLFTEDGIWFSKHLLAGNVAQCTLCLVLAAFFVQFYRLDLFQQGLDHLDRLTGGSQKWRLMLALFFGVICGEIAIIIITANSIPSTVRTIQRFRSGGYESLHNKKFQTLRCAVDNSTLLFGSMFWGTLYTSISFGVFAMLLLGLCLWPDFAEFALIIFANAIGIGITIMLKWIVLIGFRRKYQKAYYRQSVGFHNIIGVVLESWNLGLTTSYMLVRGLKLLLAAILFIGRVDIPFLSEEACFLGPFELDAYPLIFKKDVLAHEAHRHPYLERMGVMYMMKLRQDKFGNHAGTCWRLIFVYALLPWMRKYRNSGDMFGLSDFKFGSSRLWTGRMPPPRSSGEDSDSPYSEFLKFLESDDTTTNDSTGTQSETCVDGLEKKNQMLKKENEILRSLLHQSTSVKTNMTNSCPPRIFSKRHIAD